MLIEVSQTYLTVKKEENDCKLYSESAFMYNLKSKLNTEGYNLIKRLMYKDGHLVSDSQYYLRSKNVKSKTALCIYDGMYAIRNAAEDYNNGLDVTLIIDRNL